MIGLEQFFRDDGRPVSRTKRVVRVVVALGLALVPLVAALALAHRRAVVRRWPVVPCAMVDSDVDVDPGPAGGHPYHVRVTFGFGFAGQTWVGTRRMWGAVGTDDAAAAYAEARRLRAAAPAACAVDPAAPGDAVLVEPDPAWTPAVVPGCAVLAGVVAWFYAVPQLGLARAGRQRQPVPVNPARRRRSSRLAGAGLLVGFGAATVVWWGMPLARAVAGRRWPAVPCVVERSGLLRSELSGELPITLYRTDVLYRYQVGGVTYHSNCYAVTEGASPLAGPRQRVVDRYPPGTAATCRVDPSDPTAAALTDHLSPTLAFGLLPLSLAAVGLVVLVLPTGGGRPARLLRRSRWSLLAVTLAGLSLVVRGVLATP